MTSRSRNIIILLTGLALAAWVSSIVSAPASPSAATYAGVDQRVDAGGFSQGGDDQHDGEGNAR